MQNFPHISHIKVFFKASFQKLSCTLLHRYNSSFYPDKKCIAGLAWRKFGHITIWIHCHVASLLSFWYPIILVTFGESFLVVDISTPSSSIVPHEDREYYMGTAAPHMFRKISKKGNLYTWQHLMFKNRCLCVHSKKCAGSTPDNLT